MVLRTTFRVVCGLIDSDATRSPASTLEETDDSFGARFSESLQPTHDELSCTTFSFPDVHLLSIRCDEVNRSRLQAGQPEVVIATSVPREFVEKVANWGWPGQARGRHRGQSWREERRERFGVDDALRGEPLA